MSTIVETADTFIPTDPAMRKKIFDCMGEISKSFTRQEAERSYVNDAIKAIAADSGVPKKILRKLARTMHSGSIDKAVGEVEQVQALHDAIVHGDGQ